MDRVITVKGTGSVSLKPDTAVVSVTLKTLDPEYDTSMEQSADLLRHLRTALAAIGFGEEDLKTTDFNVCAKYESVRNQNGRCKSVFVGYACIHRLQLEFGFDTDLLSQVLRAVARCVAEPELNIHFTVKDKDRANDELLRSAAVNAKHKAEILAAASGTALGRLISIDYSWGEINIYSRTEYAMDAKCMAMPCGAGMDFHPEDIDLQDSATFVWEMQ